jgi:hypothetical protein
VAERAASAGRVVPAVSPPGVAARGRVGRCEAAAAINNARAAAAAAAAARRRARRALFGRAPPRRASGLAIWQQMAAS